VDANSIAQVRSFNRTVAERIGALDSRFLGRGRPMGESRTLWEIGPEGADIRELRARLALDSGYTSRVLRSLERQGLVSVGASLIDRRVRRVELTPKGRAERDQLDRLSDEAAARILEPLGEGARDRLVAAMRDVERLLRATMVRIAVEDPTSQDARWCIAQYFAELDARFEGGFDPALSISADAAELTLPAGALILARLEGRPVGCGAIKFHEGAPAELKRMWVAPEARGLGLGRRLLAELERLGSDRGATALRLETNAGLREAIALYRDSGFVEVPAFNDEPYAHYWFEKRLERSGGETRRSS
jgi:DNA-binding MarR family transcriptional regulator/GNAT superfamily N-acetyltransferase